MVLGKAVTMFLVYTLIIYVLSMALHIGSDGLAAWCALMCACQARWG